MPTSLILSIALFAATPIYRCEAQGKIRYQASLCAPHESAKQIQLQSAPSLLPSEIAAISLAQRNEFAARPQSRSQGRNTRRSAGQRRASTARAQRSAPQPNAGESGAYHGSRRRTRKPHVVAQVYRAGCPETLEESGTYLIQSRSFTAPAGRRQKSKRANFDAEFHYKLLPSKTYLKNAGLWPAHCGD
jgi:hypothetical protein